MKFSMNGFRRNLSDDVDQLRHIVQRMVNGEYYDEEDLVEITNEIICHSNCLNCVHIDDDELFNDMSHLEVSLVEEEDEGL